MAGQGSVPASLLRNVQQLGRFAAASRTTVQWATRASRQLNVAGAAVRLCPRDLPMTALRGVCCSAAPEVAGSVGAGTAGGSGDLPNGGDQVVNNCVPLPGLALPVTIAAVPERHGRESGSVTGSLAAAASAHNSGVGLECIDDPQGFLAASQDDIDQYVQNVLEHEIENINQAVHAAFEQEMGQVNQTVQEAVENALLDRSFDVKANLNTIVALTGVIMYWRGIWNLFDSWLGTDNITANVGSVLIGLSVMLLFRIFKLPLAEFW